MPDAAQLTPLPPAAETHERVRMSGLRGLLGSDMLPLLMSTGINTETAEKAAGFFSGLLTGWGVKAVWAKVIVGAVMGALTAVGILNGGL